MLQNNDFFNQQLLRKIDEFLNLFQQTLPKKIIPPSSLDDAHFYIWRAEHKILKPIKQTQTLPLSLLKGIDHIKNLLLQNSLQFAKGFPANNSLIWGARGMGKSSLVKTVCAHLSADYPLKLIEIHRDDLFSLAELVELLAPLPYRCILFCDDLSFETDEKNYKALKSLLDGSLASRPENILFYSTSNRKHLLPRMAIENESSTAICPSEAIEEKVSLSDRFGLWLGVHQCSQDDYLQMVDDYLTHFQLPVINREEIHKKACEWAITRGHQSGRVAWQFIQDIAGKMEKQLQKYPIESQAN